MNEEDIRDLMRAHPIAAPLADGKSKTLWPTTRPGVCLMSFKPHARSITSRREEDVVGSDHWRLLATLEFYLGLEKEGITTPLRYPKAIGWQGKLFLAVAAARPVPIEWIARYEAAGSIVRLFPGLVREGQRFDRPLFKYDYKQDIAVAGVDDPTLNESYIVGLGLLSEDRLIEAKTLLRRVADLIHSRLAAARIRLIDLKMEFGFDGDDRLMLIDEISQDCIRAADVDTGLSLTKDLFRQLKSTEEVTAAYEAFARRLRPDIEGLIWTCN